MYNINELAPWIRSLTSKISLLLFFVFCFLFFFLSPDFYLGIYTKTLPPSSTYLYHFGEDNYPVFGLFPPIRGRSGVVGVAHCRDRSFGI